MRTLSVQIDRDGDIPELWEAILQTIETKHSEYAEKMSVEFWELPPKGHYSYWEEPEDASCTVTGFDKDYHKLATMTASAENADIASDSEGSYSGYLVTIVTLKEPLHIREQYALIPKYKEHGYKLEGFEFVDLKRVEYPKLDVPDLKVEP